MSALFAFALLFAVAGQIAAEAATAAPNLVDITKWELHASPQDASFTVAVAPGPDGAPHHILKVNVTTAMSPYYLSQLSQLLETRIPANHLLRYHFWAKAANGNFIRALVEHATPPYGGFVTIQTNMTPEWKEYSATANVPEIDPGSAGIRLQVGKQTGEIDFADITLTDLGLDPNIAAAARALQAAAIQARIRRYRMADMTIHVVGPGGKLLRAAKVTVRQTRHAFLFGCNFFGLSQNDPDQEFQDAYRERFAALFNYATLPFYWSGFEPEPGKTNFAQLKWMAGWCVAHGIEPKGHPLVWHETYPSWAPNNPDAAIPLLRERVRQIITNMSPTIHYFDVINEASSGALGYTPPNGESQWVVRDGAPKVIETVLGWARADGAGLGDTFIVNDYETGQPNVDVMTQLQRDHDLPDVIGIQSHMHTGVWPPEKIWAVCQAFAQFHRPIHFTETTVLSTDTPHAVNMDGPAATDWLTTPDGEATQASYVAQFYTILFSHPALRAITWWDFSDRNAWLGAPSGFLRKDASPKPVYGRLMDLIHHQWWTNAAGQTSSGGAYTVHAFYGDYTVTVTTAAGKTVTKSVTMPEASGPKTVTIAIR